MTPTARTLRKLRADGWLADVVERWIPRARVRKDLFGCIDILAIRETETLAIQATSGSNLSSRVKKMEGAPALPLMRDAGWRVEAWGWRKLAEDGWQPRVVDLS